MPRTSAGILLYRLRGSDPEVLLGHMGGPFWAKKDAGAWSIPKGEHGPDEDPLAVSVVEHVASRLARIVATFASIYDPSRVIIAGAVAESCEPMLELVRHELDRYLDPPGIEVLASGLGREIVTLGAVRRALDHVREHALEIAPAELR